MNVFEYIQSMKEASNPIVGIAGAAILALFLVFIILKMLSGMRRGVWRQLVRTGMTLLAAAVSYFAAVYLSNHIIGSLNIESLEDLIETVNSYLPGIGDAIRSALSSVNTELIEYMILLPATLIIIPIIATLIFLVINLVLKIARAIIIKVIGFKKAKNNSQRLGGALLAAVEGIIWVIMVTLPLSAIFSLVNSVYEQATSRRNADTSSIIELYEEYVAPFTQNPASTFVQQAGANALADGIATVTINEQPTNIREEVLSVAHIVIVDANALKDADFTALKDYEKAAVSSIVTTFSDSPLMSQMLVGALNTVPQIYESGLIPINLGDTPVGGMVDTVMSFLEETTHETLDEDLSTLTDVYFGFCDSGLMTAITEGEDIMEFIKEDYRSEEQHILNMINTLSGYERTEGIVDSMYDVVLNAAFSGTNGAPESDNAGSGNGSGDHVHGDAGDSGNNADMPEISVQQIKDGITKIAGIKKENFATDEEYIEELSNKLIQVAKDTLNIELKKEMTVEAAKFINENLTEEIARLEEVTKDKIKFNELVFGLLDAYQCYNDGEEINTDVFKEILGDDFFDDVDDLIPEE